jgi:cytidyltransferase-like protein
LSNNSKLSSIEKKINSIIYCNSLCDKNSDIKTITKSLFWEKNYVESICNKMIKKGLIFEKNGNIFLTNKGRSKVQIVLVGGVFDIIHPGHIFSLKSSKKLGDILIVSVARNKTVLATKKRNPINDEKKRLELVNSIKYVDLALLGNEVNILKTVERVIPNLIVLGYDQKHDEQKLKNELNRRRFSIKIIRLDTPLPQIKSSFILKNSDALSSF